MARATLLCVLYTQKGAGGGEGGGYGESDTIPAQKQTELRQTIRTNSIQYTTHALQTAQLAHADDECFELMNSYILIALQGRNV